MFDLGSILDSDDLVKFCDVDGRKGLQAGIIINETDHRTILIQTLTKNMSENRYPNKWDDNIPCMIHFYATRKGVTSKIKRINLESRLNKYVNEGIYPIYLFARYPDTSFRFLGEFVRLPKYDVRVIDGENESYVFALISKNIASIEKYVDEIKFLFEQPVP